MDSVIDSLQHALQSIIENHLTKDHFDWQIAAINETLLVQEMKLLQFEERLRKAEGNQIYSSNNILKNKPSDFDEQMNTVIVLGLE